MAYSKYSVSTNFCLRLIEPSAREVFIFGLLSREMSGGELREEKRTWPKSSEIRNSVRAKVKD